jgi:excisionase family DNA binding protein
MRIARIKTKKGDKQVAKGNNVFTTGQVAQICNVASRTANKWFDKGLLKGYRIPGSRDRRVPSKELKRFMKAHNIPLDAFPAEYDDELKPDSASSAE